MELALPDVNTLVRIEVRDGLVLPSRVEEVDGRDLLLSAPRFIGNVVPPEPGDEFGIHWTGQRGLCAVPGEFVTALREPRPLWVVRVGGGVEVVQRRRYVREAVDGPVSFVAPEAEYDSVRVGSMLDLSEGGVRVRLTRNGGSSDDTVVVRMAIEGEVLSVAGTVLRVEPRSGGFEEVVVQFDEDHPHARATRRFVLDQQARRRRTGTV